MNDPGTEFAIDNERNVMPKKKQHVELSDPNLSALSCGSLFHLLLDALQQLVSATFVGATWLAGDRSCQHDLADRGPVRGSRTGDRGWITVVHISSSGRCEYLEASRGGSTALALTAPIGIIATGALLPNLPGIFAALAATPTTYPWR